MVNHIRASPSSRITSACVVRQSEAKNTTKNTEPSPGPWVGFAEALKCDFWTEVVRVEGEDERRVGALTPAAP